MHIRRVLVWLLLVVPWIASKGYAQVEAGQINPILLRSGSGVARFPLTNHSNAPVRLALQTGPVLDATSGIPLQPPAITFSLEAGGGSLPAMLAPGITLLLVMDVSHLTGSSQAKMRLFNGSQALAEVDLLAVDDPLKVSLEGAGQANQPVSAVINRPFAIALHNDSAEFLSLAWTFSIRGHAEGQGSIRLSPGGTGWLTIMPSQSAYTFDDMMYPSHRVGELRLRLLAPQGAPTDLVPEKVLPLNLRMSYGDSTRMFSIYWVLICLTFGWFVSYLVNQIRHDVLPGLFKKVELERKVNDLGNRISNSSSHLDPYLATLLQIEQRRIVYSLRFLSSFSFAFAQEISDDQAAIESLQKRLMIAERLEGLGRDFEKAVLTAPPSVSFSLDDALTSAAERLSPLVLQDHDILEAIRFLDEAEASLTKLGDDNAQAKLIAGRFAELRQRMSAFPRDYYTDLREALPRIFQIVEGSDADATIYPPAFFATDHAIAAAHLALDYATIRAAMPVSRPDEVPEGRDSSLCLRLHERELIRLLGTSSWRALRNAKCLLGQMQEDIYVHDLMEKFEQKRAQIVFETRRARSFKPVIFSIRFEDPRLNGAAATEWLSAQWYFPGDYVENGWKVCHYFQGSGTPTRRQTRIQVKVKVQDSRDPSAPACELQTEMLPPQRRGVSSQVMAEMMRTLLAMSAALVGVVSGAFDKLASMGFIKGTAAVVALGFGADTVKNILVRSSQAGSSANSNPDKEG